MRTRRGAWLGVALSLAGLTVCAYLIYLHLALVQGQLIGGVGCRAAGEFFNCHAVTASPFGRFLGLPLASWGFLGYLATLALALIAWQFPAWAPRALTALAGAGLLFVAVDAGLLVVMLTQVRALCLLCLATDGINLALLGVALWALGPPWPRILRAIPGAWAAFRPAPGVVVPWVVWGTVLTGAAGVAGVQATAWFMSRGVLESVRQQLAHYVRHEPRLAVDTAGAPRRGAADGSIQLMEFSDFLCAGCQQAAQFNAILLAGRRRETTLFFKHFPLDAACNGTVQQTVHPGACRIAAAAACAQEQGKFWAFHDRVFQRGPSYDATDVDADAARLGLDLPAFRECLASGRGMAVVRQDIADAERLQITSTPSYVVNGIPIQGTLTPAVFEEVVAVLRDAPPPPASDPRD